MKEARYFYAPAATESSELPADEAAHALRVLRLSVGDELFLMDGRGTFYRAEVTMAAGKHCAYRILDTLPQQKTWRGHLHLAMAPTKMMERTEWMAEKATEMGIDEFSFLDCRFSERRQMRADRVEKIVTAAVKQSRKPWMPRVNAMQRFDTFLDALAGDACFIAHCYDEIPKTDLFCELQQLAQSPSLPEPRITVLVGPEGDFSIDEVRRAVSRGAKSVSLGRSRLRTETAALAAAMMMQLAFRKP